MDIKKRFNELLGEFGTMVGIPELASDEDGICTIGLDDTFVLHIGVREGGADVAVSSALGSVDPERRAEMFTELLAENLFPDTLDMAFAWDRQHEQVVLTAKAPLGEMDGQLFSQFLERFMDVATHWEPRLSDQTEERPVAPEPSPVETAEPSVMFHPKFMA